LLSRAAVHGTFAPYTAFTKLYEKILSWSNFPRHNDTDILCRLLSRLVDSIGSRSLLI